MINREAHVLSKSSSSIIASSAEFDNNFKLPESEFHTIFRKFRELKSEINTFLKRIDLGCSTHVILKVIQRGDLLMIKRSLKQKFLMTLENRSLN